jgi:membrane protein required for colicin V production
VIDINSLLWIDFVIIAIISIFFCRGFLRGFRIEVFSLVFWLLGIIIGFVFCKEFSIYFESIFKLPMAKTVAAFASLLFITQIVGLIIRLLLGAAIKKPQLLFIDRLSGMIVGLINGMVGVVIAVLLAGLTNLPKELWWTQSIVVPPFQLSAMWLRDKIPTELTENVHYPKYGE